MDVISGDFEWDSKKSESNLKKHGVAFEDSKEVFNAAHPRFRSDRSDEARWLTIGQARGRVVAVIHTERQGRIRIISARTTRTSERESYHRLIGGAP